MEVDVPGGRYIRDGLYQGMYQVEDVPWTSGTGI